MLRRKNSGNCGNSRGERHPMARGVKKAWIAEGRTDGLAEGRTQR